jgi:hypothetical protein
MGALCISQLKEECVLLDIGWKAPGRSGFSGNIHMDGRIVLI